MGEVHFHRNLWLTPGLDSVNGFFMKAKNSKPLTISFVLWAASLLTAQAQLIWTVGQDDNGWPCAVATPCTGGGANANFVQEGGGLAAFPGSPNSPLVDQGADNDYYFAGTFDTPISSIIDRYGPYTPIGAVTANEEVIERAFYITDNEMRIHFNLDNALQPADLLSVTFDILNLDAGAEGHTVTDPHWGVEVYFNGVLVQPEISIRPAQTGTAFTTPQFSLATVNAGVGAGPDNVVTLKGINYNSEGGGDWMGIDYVQLNRETNVVPAAVFPWAVGRDDDAWPAGNGGGPDATFVQEDGNSNPLPGNPASPEIDQQADDDYYFAGSYTTAIAGNGAYTTVGLVPVNEEAAERGFSGNDNELRFHFNLPNSVAPDQLLAVTFEALNLDTTAADPRYGVEVYFNGVKVQPEVLIRPDKLMTSITTVPFTAGSVNAAVGAGFDNIVTLRGINHSADNGGNSMGIDYVQLNPSTNTIPAPVLPWSAGWNDNGWPFGTGGGTNATFVAPDGSVSPLPGSATDTDEFLADNDYYFAGAYTTVIPGNGVYTPAGLVFVNEGSAEGGFSGADNELRYHFNLPATLQSNDLLTVTFDPLDLSAGADPRYGVEVYFNNVLVQTQIVIRTAQLDVPQTTPPFTLASVNAQVGPGFDNIITLKGINYSAEGGGDSMGFDYIQLTPKTREVFPWLVGRNDNTHIRGGNGGGPDASFMQENGAINPLPGSATNPEVDQQEDNDYYFGGEYTTAIPGVVSRYGNYTPLGTVLANEEGAERAFAGGDNDLRYHFNLPGTLDTNMPVVVTFDALDLDGTAAEATRRYGVEVYFNGVLVATQRVITPSLLGLPNTTPPFTLGSVDARLGPGPDNIVSLKGINYNAEGGGNWMGIDYVQLTPVNSSPFPWAVGRDDDSWPAGDGGGPDATFVQENGNIQAIPGNPASPEVNGQADNDYYFAGSYSTSIAGNGTYTPVGLVPVNEEAAERAFAGNDTELRYHFNLPDTLSPNDQLVVTFDALNLSSVEGGEPGATDPHYGVEVYFNGVLVQTNIVIRTNLLGVAFTTPPFSLASVNAQVGPGFDNIVSLKGVSYSAEGGGSWMGFDYIQLGPVPLRLAQPVISNNQITLNWTGTGGLEWAPTVRGPWTPITPAPTPPYSEAVVTGTNRFFRLTQP